MSKERYRESYLNSFDINTFKYRYIFTWISVVAILEKEILVVLKLRQRLKRFAFTIENVVFTEYIPQVSSGKSNLA